MLQDIKSIDLRFKCMKVKMACLFLPHCALFFPISTQVYSALFEATLMYDMVTLTDIERLSIVAKVRMIT